MNIVMRATLAISPMAALIALIGCSTPAQSPAATAPAPVVAPVAPSEGTLLAAEPTGGSDLAATPIASEAPVVTPSVAPPVLILPEDLPQADSDVPITEGIGDAPVSFLMQVTPILKRNCATCHSPRAAGAEAGLYFNAKGQILYEEVSNNAFQILESIEQGRMPADNPGAVTTEEVEQIKTWVFTGALQN